MNKEHKQADYQLALDTTRRDLKKFRENIQIQEDWISWCVKSINSIKAKAHRAGIELK